MDIARLPRPTRILLTGIGGGASDRLAEEIERSGNYTVLGTNCDRYFVARSRAEGRQSFLVEEAKYSNYPKQIETIVQEHDIDFIIPNSSPEVRILGLSREMFPGKLLLPSDDTIWACQDKLFFYRMLRDASIPTPVTWSYSHLLGPPRDGPFWIRPRKGAGSKGATRVDSREEMDAWVSYWCRHRDYKPNDFLVHEYLPGRDIVCLTLWKDGRLVLLKTAERLRYLMGDQRPSGQSSTADVSRTYYKRDLACMIMRAVLAIDPQANGLWPFDLKGDAEGNLKITECNIGRFPGGTLLFNESGDYNMAKLYINAGHSPGVRYEPISLVDYEPGVLEVRDVDQHPYLIKEADLD